MKNHLKFLTLALLAFLFFSTTAKAGDVYVNGYHRKDGTYVQPHVRSAPDGIRSNNYGPSQTSTERMNPRARDYDRDGTPNYLDTNDDNDSVHDNQDTSQYGYGR